MEEHAGSREKELSQSVGMTHSEFPARTSQTQNLIPIQSVPFSPDTVLNLSRRERHRKAVLTAEGVSVTPRS